MKLGSVLVYQITLYRLRRR